MDSWKYGIAWSSDLETGNEAIDSQHKQLYKLASDLIESCLNGACSATLSEALDFLAAYTVKHFSDEEALQLQYHYPNYETHKQMHEDFKKTVGELITQHNAGGSSTDLSAKVNSIVIQWLIQHIRREDFKIAAHIRRQQERTIAQRL